MANGLQAPEGVFIIYGVFSEEAELSLLQQYITLDIHQDKQNNNNNR